MRVVSDTSDLNDPCTQLQGRADSLKLICICGIFCYEGSLGQLALSS